MKNLLIVPIVVNATGPAPRVEFHLESARGADCYFPNDTNVDLLALAREAKARADAISAVVARSITAEEWRLHQTLSYKRPGNKNSGAHQRGGTCHLKEVLNELGAFEGQEALGMKLHTVQRPGLVTHAHDLALGRPGVDDEVGGDSLLADDQAVIARGFKRVA